MAEPMAHQYRPDVDGLRALAVLAVVAFHAAPLLFPGGFLGVDVFFVISGFLISGLVLDQLRAGKFTMSGFYLRRARRILPALLLMLFVTSLMTLLILMPDELQDFAKLMISSVTFVPNLALLSETGYFDVGAHMKPLLHMWSLGVEEQFYFIWPFFLMLMARRDRPAFTLGIICVLAVISFLVHLYVFRDSPESSFYLPFTRFWELMIGAALAAVPAGVRLFGASRFLPAAASVLGVLLMVGAMTLADDQPNAYVGIAPTLGAAMFIAAGPQALPNRTAFAWRPVVYVGLISYPLYLWHWPPLSFLHIMELDRGVTGAWLQLGAVVFAVLAAMATYRFIELPVRGRKDLRRLGVRLVSLLGTAAVAGVVVAGTGGLPQRTSLDHNPFVRTEAMRREDRCSNLYAQPAEHRKNAFCVRNDY